MGIFPVPLPPPTKLLAKFWLFLILNNRTLELLLKAHYIGPLWGTKVWQKQTMEFA